MTPYGKFHAYKLPVDLLMTHSGTIIYHYSRFQIFGQFSLLKTSWPLGSKLTQQHWS